MHWLHLFHLMAHFDQHLDTAIAAYGGWVYLMLFALIFCEIAFLPLFFLPGDPLLFMAGAFCAGGALNLWWLILLLWLATVTGSAVSFALGRALANSVLTRDYRWLNKNSLRRAQAFYEHRGGNTFLISPFLAVLRTFLPFAGGVARMSWPRFFVYTSVGALLWAVALPCSGYWFGNIPFIHQSLGVWVMVGMGSGLGSIALGALWRWYRQVCA